MILRSLTCKALLVALALAALPVGMASRASAAILPTFSVTPTSILEGDSATLNLHLALDGVPPDFSFLGGLVTLSSGLEASSSILPIGIGVTTQDFAATFSYPTAGSYTLSFLVDAIVGDPAKPPPKDPSFCVNCT